MATLLCRVQFLDDTDPFNSTNFPEPTRPPLYTFRQDIPLGTQLPGVHRLLRAPHKVRQRGGDREHHKMPQNDSVGCLWQLKRMVWGWQSSVGLCGPGGCCRGCAGSRAAGWCWWQPLSALTLLPATCWQPQSCPPNRASPLNFSGFAATPSISGILTSFPINLASARWFCRVCWRKKK